MAGSENISLHRYTTILNAASSNDKTLAGPMTAAEQKVFDWARTVIEQAKKDGVPVKWDIPFDYDDA